VVTGINYMTSGFTETYGSVIPWVTFGMSFNEPFAITIQNQYRATQGLEIRGHYINSGDYSAP
jgi:hypothetical protein